MKLEKQITTDAEAWDFLINLGGDFRIHTNKNGLRLYISVCSRKYSGYFKAYEYRYDPKYPFDKDSLSGRPLYIHREGFVEKDDIYRDTVTGNTLVEMVNKHIEMMPGEVLHNYDLDFDKNICNDKTWCNWTLEFKGSLEDFRKLNL